MPNPFQTILFDFDSTLIRVESLDLLAEQKGIGEEVSRLTEASMDGSVPIQDVFPRKMRLLSPTRAEAEGIGRACKDLLVEDAAEVIAALQRLGKDVRIMSSGFKDIIIFAAQDLGIAPEHIIANRLEFDAAGNFLAFHDDGVPLVSDGKRQKVARLGLALPSTVFVGDGATDAAVQGSVGMFIGFGGVAHRPRVAAAADAYITEPRLAPLLRHILLPNELDWLEKNGFEELLLSATMSPRPDAPE